MLKLQLYSGRELQKFISILEQFKIDKITDSKNITDVLRSEVNRRFASTKKAEKIEKSKQVKISNKDICPSCKQRALTLVQNKENLQIFGCSKCRYSEIREKK